MMSAAPGNDYELGPLPAAVSPIASHTARTEPENGTETEHGLAPVDGGLAAWRLLGAAFVFETLLWGTSSPLLVIIPHRQYQFLSRVHAARTRH
jgi:hypothetical protein